MISSRVWGSSCSLCPGTDWFELCYSIGKKLGRKIEFVKATASLDFAREYEHLRIPKPDIYIYIDNDLAVFEDIEDKIGSNLLVVPLKHIRQIDELGDYPEIAHKCYNTAAKIVRAFPSYESTVLTKYRPLDVKQPKPILEHVHFQIKSTHISAEEAVRLARQALN